MFSSYVSNHWAGVSCHVVFQDGDQTSLSFVARSLVTLQQLCGTIPSVYGLGNCAKVLYFLPNNV